MITDFVGERVGCVGSDGFCRVLGLIPPRIKRKILAICENREDFPVGLSEISLRTVGGCFICISGENISLGQRLQKNEAEELYYSLTEGSLYAHIDTVKDGYITIDGGVRVGICSEMRYNGGQECIVGHPESFIFRIPSSHPSFSAELYELWQNDGRPGMLIFSSPGGGKTTLIKALAGLMSKGSAAAKCAVIDERREFIPGDYQGCCIDILRGCEKIKGIEIAKRTLSPEVIVIDELSGIAQARALRECGRGGVCLVATAHAGSYEELIESVGIRELLEGNFFGIVAEIGRTGGKFNLKIHKSKNLCSISS